MKTIMFFGDSNTWGYNPINARRYPFDVRFTGIVSEKLNDCRIIEEGLKGRTNALSDDLQADRNGLRSLPMLLCTHDPIDILVIMLGTNDVKRKFHNAPTEIANGLELLIQTAQMPLLWGGEKTPRILVVCPPGVTGNFKCSEMEGSFDLTSVEKSLQLHEAYQKIAVQYGCDYLNAMDYTGPGVSDGVHLEEEEHKKMAEALIIKLQTMI